MYLVSIQIICDTLGGGGVDKVAKSDSLEELNTSIFIVKPYLPDPNNQQYLNVLRNLLFETIWIHVFINSIKLNE